MHNTPDNQARPQVGNDPNSFFQDYRCRDYSFTLKEKCVHFHHAIHPISTLTWTPWL